jgi:polyphosphate kinase
LIEKLKRAAEAGVEVKLIVRGIFCPILSNKKFKIPIQAISIVDEYLEHGRVMIFGVDKTEKIYISSADWMVRNLDHRVEAAVEITDTAIKQEIRDIINIQLKDNVKARFLDAELSNNYVLCSTNMQVRSQVETYKYLASKINKRPLKTNQLTVNK